METYKKVGVKYLKSIFKPMGDVSGKQIGVYCEKPKDLKGVQV